MTRTPISSSILLSLAGGVAALAELKLADRRFVPAEAKLVGDELTVSSAEVVAPLAVRYAWRNAPETDPNNVAAFPLAPFRSDNG